MGGRLSIDPLLSWAALTIFAMSVAWIDHQTAGQLHLTVLYLVPIGLATWTAGRRAGTISAAACAGLSLVNDFWPPSGPPASVLVVAWDASFRLGVFAFAATVQSRLSDMLDSERRLARSDALTNLANLRMFREAVERELVLSRRAPRPFAVALIDVDDFKQVNDRLGHKAGDAVLNLLAAQLRGILRNADLCARIGGDEFAALLPGTDHDVAVRVLSGLPQRLQRGWPPGRPRVTVSLGAVTFDRAPSSVDEVVARADYEMYRVKRLRRKDGVSIARAHAGMPFDRCALNSAFPAEPVAAHLEPRSGPVSTTSGETADRIQRAGPDRSKDLRSAARWPGRILGRGRGQPSLERWLSLVRAEYLEMPDLELTKSQIQRLWGLDAATCDTIVNALLSSHFLRRSPRQGYILGAK